MRKRVLGLTSAAALAVAGLLAGPTGALAASVKIGSTFTGASAFPPTTTYIVVSTAATSPKYVVPAHGARITGFSVQGGTTTGAKVKLKVFRKATTPGTWTVIGQSTAVTLTPSKLDNFTTSIAVHPADVLGLTDLSTGGGAPIFRPGFATGDVLGEGPGDPAVGASYTPQSDSQGGFRMNVSATVQLQPVITKVNPASGPAAGGTTVTITGANLTGATAVKFGTVPARSFRVVSTSTISAVAPSEPAGTTIGIRVTTPGGTSAAVAADHYSYQ